VELLVVLWSLRMTPSRAIGYTPFFMVYGVEAVLPTDLDYGAPGSRNTESRRPGSTSRMPWISLMKPMTLLSSTPPNTSRHYADTTAVGSRAEPSMLGT
jgi:hypothetical protein